MRKREKGYKRHKYQFKVTMPEKMWETMLDAISNCDIGRNTWIVQAIHEKLEHDGYKIP